VIRTWAGAKQDWLLRTSLIGFTEMEFLLLFVAWIIPLAVVVFVVSALWQIVKALGQITTELAKIREGLERERRP
jgi:hypothetical protein